MIRLVPSRTAHIIYIIIYTIKIYYYKMLRDYRREFFFLLFIYFFITFGMSLITEEFQLYPHIYVLIVARCNVDSRCRKMVFSLYSARAACVRRVRFAWRSAAPDRAAWTRLHKTRLLDCCVQQAGSTGCPAVASRSRMLQWRLVPV